MKISRRDYAWSWHVVKAAQVSAIANDIADAVRYWPQKHTEDFYATMIRQLVESYISKLFAYPIMHRHKLRLAAKALPVIVRKCEEVGIKTTASFSAAKAHDPYALLDITFEYGDHTGTTSQRIQV